MAKEGDRFLQKEAFVEIEAEMVVGEMIEDVGEVREVSILVWRSDKNIIEVHSDEG